MENTNTHPVVGWIGTGVMGLPMARNLMRAGYPLRVHARKPQRIAELVAAGAQACASPAEATHGAAFTIVMVADTPDVAAVALGADGLRDGAAAGHIVIDMSTIAPARAREIAQELARSDVTLLDAPVSGGERGAIDGTLSIMVGGPEDAVRTAWPILEVLGAQIRRIGDSGAGQVAKACNQLVVAQTLIGIAEAFRLARACGVDPAQVREALLGGFGASRALEVHGQRMLDDDYRPGFRAALHSKDLNIVADEARRCGLNLSGNQYAAQLMAALVDGGGADLDSAAIAREVWKATDRAN